MDMEYLYLTKYDIPLECGLKVKQYSIDEIQNYMGYDRYEHIIWSMTRYPYEFKFDLEDSGLDYKNTTDYDIFLMLNGQRNIDEVSYELNYIFGENFQAYRKDGDLFFISENGNKIDRSTFSEIKKVLSSLLFLKKPKERKPANKKAKELIKRQIKLNAKKKVKYNIYSIMESLVWSDKSSYDYESIINLTPRQIYAGYSKIEQLTKFNNTLNGIYAGVIKSADVDFDSINWVNKI